jgi:hypothetical protein
MTRPDPGVERELTAFAQAIETALGADLVCLALHGSAVGEDWVAGRSDVNTALVVSHVTLDVLDRLAPVAARFVARGFALPVIMDREYLARARDTFPMELDDIRRDHRMLAGTDCFADLALDAGAVRRQLEREARGKLLRLRALYLEAAGSPAALDRLMGESVKSFLAVLRHFLRLRGVEAGRGYVAVVDAGERVLGPFPAMRRVLERRDDPAGGASPALAVAFAAYLAEVERIVAAVDAQDA